MYMKPIKIDDLQMQHAFYASRQVDVFFWGGVSTDVDFIAEKVNVEHSDTQNKNWISFKIMNTLI